MNEIFFLLMTFLLSFCEADIPKSDRKIPIKDKVIEIIFSEDIILKWEVYNNRFEKDDFYQKIKENSKNLIFLKKSISDTTNLGIRICSKEKLLRKGDIAFLYLQDIGKIPLYHCLKIQFDVFEQRCPFPDGLLDYVENNREIVKNEIIRCYKK